MRRIRFALVCTIIGIASAACGKDPEVAREEFMRSGDEYLAKNQLSEAVIQYRNAVQTDPQSGMARVKLADIYMRVGEPQNAIGEFVRAADLLPQDVEAQLNAGRMLLITGQFEDAQTRADNALALSPSNVDAHILRANALARLKRLDDAIDEVETAISGGGGGSSVYSTLGTLHLTEGNQYGAEAAYRKAVELDPASVTAQLALANFYWVSGRLDEAEVHLKSAVETKRNDALTNRVIGWFYVTTGRAGQAEPHFKALAEMLPDGTGTLMLAAYYMSVRRTGEAKAVLEPLAEPGASTFAMATLALARIAVASGDVAQGSRLVDAVLARNTTNAEALVMKAGLLTGQRKADEALTAARGATAADPNSAYAHFVLGSIQAMRGEYRDARTAFSQAVQLSPRYTAAQIELARLYLVGGEAAEARQLVEAVLETSPNHGPAQLLLARIERVTGNVAAAERQLKALSSSAPNSLALQTELARVQSARENPTAARATFEQILAKDPTNAEALAELTALDFRANRPQPAKARLDAALQRAPNDARLLMLSGRAHVTMGELSKAEGLLRKALAADPGRSREVSTALAQLYLQQGRVARALGELDTLAQRNPRWVAPQVMMATILQGENRRAEAKDRYRKALAIDPGAYMAANNLAFMYAEDNERLEEALQLAQAAKARLPEAPETANTLGFVYYKKELPDLAVASLQDAVRMDPENTSFQYHLGLAHFKNGDMTRAREVLESALKKDPASRSATEARATLARLANLGM
jgi:Tfp pilus assembly protein PilF